MRVVVVHYQEERLPLAGRLQELGRPEEHPGGEPVLLRLSAGVRQVLACLEGLPVQEVAFPNLLVWGGEDGPVVVLLLATDPVVISKPRLKVHRGRNWW